jgi:hypothetical protein
MNPIEVALLLCSSVGAWNAEFPGSFPHILGEWSPAILTDWHFIVPFL